MTIFELLAKDHHMLKLRLENLIEATSPSLRDSRPKVTGGDDATSQLAQLKAAVLAHGRAEESVLYDRLRTLPHRDELADLQIEQHHQVEEHLEELERMDSDSPDWEATLSLLKNELESHLAEEESTVFPLLELAIEPDESERMARSFEIARDDVYESMHVMPEKKTAPKGAPSRLTSR
jgi:iron-sulfur cluster repair protein YtfE (RIC family)